MAHLVSSDRQLLLAAGATMGMKPEWLQFKPLKNPDTAQRVEAWHWDLRGPYFEVGLKKSGPTRGGNGSQPSGR